MDWIKCSNRVPAKKDAANNNTVFTWSEVEGFNVYCWYDVGIPSYCEATHWMTPQPPRNGGEEG